MLGTNAALDSVSISLHRQLQFFVFTYMSMTFFSLVQLQCIWLCA